MQGRTAWSRGSNVPSNRIAPTHPSQTPRKNKAKSNDPPKSREVLELERVLSGLKKPSNSKDPKGGCFCKARVHSLSAYSPICLQCGLVLCSLNDPHYPCPHCACSLLSASAHDALVQKLTAEVSEVLAREREQREREARERQDAVDSFPSLPLFTGNVQASLSNQPRKVLSLNSQTKKVTVASFPPGSSTAPGSSATGAPEPVEKRVPPPPKSVDFVKGTVAEGSQWANLRAERLCYVPPPNRNTADGLRGRRRKKKNETNAP